MREVRRYSDKTVTIAARRLRRAVREIPETWGMPLAEKLHVVSTQLTKLGLQPIDIVRRNSADALAVIVQTLRPPGRGWVHDCIIVDSWAGLTGGLLTAANALTSSQATPLSTTWKRVIARALQMPGGHHT